MKYVVGSFPVSVCSYAIVEFSFLFYECAKVSLRASTLHHYGRAMVSEINAIDVV